MPTTDPIAELKASHAKKIQEGAASLFLLAAMLPSICLQALTISLIWNWYCAAWHVPEIAWRYVVGPLLIWRMVNPIRPSRDGSDGASTEVLRILSHWVFLMVAIGVAAMLRP